MIITAIVFSIIYFINKNGISDKEDIKIKSVELKSIIENNWKDDVSLGTKETTFDNYDIYFDEGLEVRNIEGKIYNIVFTEKYENKIINNIKTSTTLNEIIEELGDPDFGGTSISLIGYKYDDFYIFFNGNQASVYMNYDQSSNFEFEGNDIKSFIASVMQKWPDYNNSSIYELEGTLIHSFVDYAQKGIRLSYSDEELIVTMYNNCLTKVNDNNLYKVEVKNKNLIYEVETERQSSIHNREFATIQYQEAMNDMISKSEEPEESKEQEYEEVIKDKFIPIETNYNINEEFDLSVVSVTGKFPNTDIDTNVISYLWVNDYTIAYSIRNKGIYLYNVKKLERTIICEGNEEFFIKNITEDNELMYDDKKIKINL